MSEPDRKRLRSHGNPGVRLIVMAPSVSVKTLLYVIALMVITTVVWAFFGRADVVIACKGQVSTKEEPRRAYSPVPGELINVYFLEGESVRENTIMARIKSPEAISVATEARAAEAQYRAVVREVSIIPEKKKLLSKQLDLLRKQKRYQEESIGDTEEQLKAFEEAQKLKTEIIQDRIKRADDEIERTRKQHENYKKMFDAGAVSKKEYETQELAWKVAIDNSKTTRLKASAEFAQALDERRERLVELDKKKNDILAIELQVKRLEDEIKYMDEEARQQLELTKVRREAAQQVTFDDLDNENYLVVKAPTSGIITDVRFTQAGDKVPAATPLFTISPHEDKCLIIRISDQDRAFVEPGMPVKIKVRAFPFMRFGFLNGQLESITPTAKRSPDGKGMFYEGRVIFDRKDNGELIDYFMVRGEKREVRYGMTANAEIIIDRRRLIEFALDPFRKEKE